MILNIEFMNKFLVIIIFSLSISGCMLSKQHSKRMKAETEVIPVSFQHGIPDTLLFYALPRNKVVFTIVAEKLIKKAGPLFRYSERYLGVSDVISKDEVVYTLKTVTMTSAAEPDEKCYYAVKFSASAAPQFLSLTPDGCIKAVNLVVEDEVAVKAGVTQSSLLDTSFRNTPWLHDQVIVNSTAKMAEEAANFIYRIRENRAALVSGELNYYPADGGALSVGLQEMNRLEKDFMSLFMGKEVNEEVVYRVEYLPETEITKELLFRFSKFKGLVAKNDVSGSPYFISVQKKNNAFSVVAEQDSLSMNAMGGGFYYRIPGMASITLFDGNQQIIQQQMPVAQFGRVASLPRNLTSDGKVGILFYPHTGAVKSLVDTKR